MRNGIMLFLLTISICSYAFQKHEKPVGFLWYNLEKTIKKVPPKKPNGTPFSQLSYTKKDAVLHFYTMEALHKARYTKDMKDVKNFLAFQQYWLNESSKFGALFQKTLLYYPQYDYSVTHPTSSIGSKWMDRRKNNEKENLLSYISNHFGLMFFYRGSHTLDKESIPVILDFSKKFSIHLMPISVDGIISKAFNNNKIDTGQAKRLGIQYFPALFLVNPKTKHIQPIGYGLMTQDDLKIRLYKILTDFKGEV